MVREKELSVSAQSSNIVSIRLLLPSGEAISAPPLSAILGQLQINSSEFCKSFNTQALSRYETGSLLSVRLVKYPNNTFFFVIEGLSLTFLLFQVSNSFKYIKLEELYDSFCLFRMSTSSVSLGGTPPTFSAAREFFGTVRSCGFNIALLRKEMTFLYFYFSRFHSNFARVQNKNFYYTSPKFCSISSLYSSAGPLVAQLKRSKLSYAIFRDRQPFDFFVLNKRSLMLPAHLFFFLRVLLMVSGFHTLKSSARNTTRVSF